MPIQQCVNTDRSLSVAPIVSTPILLQQVAADGFTKIGNPTQLLTNEVDDGAYIEAPSLSYLNGKYVLFFSPQCYLTPKYSVNYAISDNILGPYTRAASPLMATGVDGLTAPGGLDIAVNGDHSMWHGNYKGGRAAYTAILKLTGSVITAQF
jgi:beta-xylosidase